MSLPVCAAFVGRAAELSALREAYQDPEVHTVLIAGEAGLGKSRLVAEFRTRISTDTVVLAGRCLEFGSDGVPFAPFVSVMRALVRRLGVAELITLLPVNRPALARWLPELAARAGSAATETDRIRLFGEILTVLEQLAVRQPVLVVLEDLHWADDSSRELLAFLLANAAQRDLLLVGTYRPADSAAMRKLVAGLRRDPGVRLIFPDPLTRHEVGRQLAALSGREPEPGTVSRIFARSNGIPLFVEALSTSPDSPGELSELLLGLHAGLPPEAEALLRLAAVAGSPVPHALLESATELDPDGLRRALRQLIDQQVLTAHDTGYEFRHILIRDAVYDHLLPIERKHLHARLSRALAADRDPAGAGQLAYHAHAAGELPLALEASWTAASNAKSAGAPAERLHHLDRVLELWDQAPEARQAATDRLEILEQIVEACYQGVIVERGIEAADEALRLVDTTGAPQRAARLFYHRAGLKNQSSRGSDDDLRRALELLPAHPPAELRGQVLAELAAAQAFTGDLAAAERNALAAVEVAEHLGAESLAARAYAYLGLATSARSDTAVAYFGKARAAATSAADPQALLSVALWESTVLIATGSHVAAIATIQQGLRAAHETFRFAEAGPILLVKWAQALTALGRWPEALDRIDESLTDQLPPLSRAALLLSHARIVIAQGDSIAANTSAETAAGLLSDGPWARQYQLRLRTVRCTIALALDQAQRAAQICAETLSAGDLAAYHHEVWPLLALAAGIPELPTDLDGIADSLPTTTPVDAAHRAVFTATRGPTPTAWHAAVSAWRAMHQPYELASALLGCAEAELAVGNRPAAQTALREVADLAADLGATPLATTAHRTAGRAGLALTDRAPEPTTARPTTFGLTPRELGVLRLVAQGLSNRQIAAELFISGNTAGVHVSRILAKLGVASRTEAAAAAHTHHLLDAEDE